MRQVILWWWDRVFERSPFQCKAQMSHGGVEGGVWELPHVFLNLWKICFTPNSCLHKTNFLSSCETKHTYQEQKDGLIDHKDTNLQLRIYFFIQGWIKQSFHLHFYHVSLIVSSFHINMKKLVNLEKHWKMNWKKNKPSLFHSVTGNLRMTAEEQQYSMVMDSD